MSKPAIFIIRPKKTARHDLQTCIQAGYRAILLDTMSIEADNAALKNLSKQYTQADIVFWVSPTSVETAAPTLDFSDGTKVQVTVGQATKKALSQYCQYEIQTPHNGNDSEAVLQLPFWQNVPQTARILIIRGHGGRDYLAQELCKKGFQVEFAEVYFRRPKQLNWKDFNPNHVVAAYVASSESVRFLFQQVPQQFSRFFKNLLYLTQHPRIAEALKQAGVENVQVVKSLNTTTLNHVLNGVSMSQLQNDPNQEPQVIAVNSEGKAVPDEKESELQQEPVKAAASPQTGNTMTEPQSQPNTQNKTTQNTPAPVVIKQSSGKGLAAGALVLALLGLGASGFLFVQGQNVLKNQELAFNQKIDKAALGDSENASLLKDNLNRQTEIKAELDRLNNGQRSNGEQIASAQKAYQELLKGRVNWLVDEAEIMLNSASQQLLLSGNIQGAISALEHINNRLSRFDQPELLPIKQAVSSDLAALKNRPYVDVSGTALRIDRLETAVASLPLLIDGALKPTTASQAEADANLSWWEKSLNSLKGLVEVRQLDNNDAMLLSPEQIYFVRENLRLRLLDARIAILQHNGEVYQSDLNNIESAVTHYFDNKSPATQSWLKELAELKALDVRMISDDALKASQAAVRTYQDGTRTQMPSENVEATPASAAVTPEPSVASEAIALPEAPALPSETKAENKAASAAKETPKAKPVSEEKVKGDKA